MTSENSQNLVHYLKLYALNMLGPHPSLSAVRISASTPNDLVQEQAEPRTAVGSAPNHRPTVHQEGPHHPTCYGGSLGDGCGDICPKPVMSPRDKTSFKAPSGPLAATVTLPPHYWAQVPTLSDAPNLLVSWARRKCVKTPFAFPSVARS